MDKEDRAAFIFLIVAMFCLGIGLGGGIQQSLTKIDLSQETADKICMDLTNESGVVAKDYRDFNGNENKPISKGELYCQIPSYDATQLIKIGN